MAFGIALIPLVANDQTVSGILNIKNLMTILSSGTMVGFLISAIITVVSIIIVVVAILTVIIKKSLCNRKIKMGSEIK